MSACPSSLIARLLSNDPISRIDANNALALITQGRLTVRRLAFSSRLDGCLQRIGLIRAASDGRVAMAGNAFEPTSTDGLRAEFAYDARIAHALEYIATQLGEINERFALQAAPN